MSGHLTYAVRAASLAPCAVCVFPTPPAAQIVSAIKALAAAKASGLPAFADDSGLCVDALDGAPGLFSARWAGPDKDFSGAMARIAAELDTRGATNRRAHFVSALVLAWPDGL